MEKKFSLKPDSKKQLAPPSKSLLSPDINVPQLSPEAPDRDLDMDQQAGPSSTINPPETRELPVGFGDVVEVHHADTSNVLPVKKMRLNVPDPETKLHQI